MNIKSTAFILSGVLMLGNGLHYFINGDAYRSSNLRSYAVAVQILIAFAITCYGIWGSKETLETTENKLS